MTIIDTAQGVDFSISPTAGFVFNLAGGGGLNTFEFSTNVALPAGLYQPHGRFLSGVAEPKSRRVW